MIYRQPHDGSNRASVLEELKRLNETNDAILQELKDFNQTMTKFKKVAKDIFTVVHKLMSIGILLFLLYSLFYLLITAIKFF